MRGHIRKRGSKWAIIVDIGTDPLTGKRQQKWFSGYRTKKDAEKDLASIITKLEENTFVIPKKMTLSSFYEYWLENRPAELSPTTITGYNFVFNKHLSPALGNLEVQNIKPLQIQEYYTEKLKTLSSTTVRHHHSLLRKMLQDAKKWQVIANNPCDNVQVPKIKKYEASVLSLEESKELMKKLACNFLEVPIHVSMFLGIRRGELLALQWKDFDFESKTVKIRRNLVRAGKDGTELIIKAPKTESSTRTLPLPDVLINLLKKHKVIQNTQKLKFGEHYDNQDFVFAREDGSPINPAKFSKMFQNFMRENKLANVRLHDLRHTLATLLLEMEVNPKIVQEILGHTVISTTLNIYSHVSKKVKSNAIDKLSDILAK